MPRSQCPPLTPRNAHPPLDRAYDENSIDASLWKALCFHRKKHADLRRLMILLAVVAATGWPLVIYLWLQKQ